MQIPRQAVLDIRFTSLSESRARVEGCGEDEDVEFGRQGGQDGPDGGQSGYVCYDAGEGGAWDVRGGVEGGNGGGEDVEVVCGFGGGVGAEDGAAAGGEVEGDGAADTFGGAAGEELECVRGGGVRGGRRCLEGQGRIIDNCDCGSVNCFYVHMCFFGKERAGTDLEIR
jgi:hypothetical protein